MPPVVTDLSKVSSLGSVPVGGMDKEVWRKANVFCLSHPPTSAFGYYGLTECKRETWQTGVHLIKVMESAR